MSAGLLALSSWRYMLGQPWQSALAVLGIALGVAVVVAIDLTQASARRAFDHATTGLAGSATHRITASGGMLDESVYTRLRRQGVTRAAAPILEARITLEAAEGRRIRLLGVDPIAEAGLRAVWFVAGDAPVTQLMTEPGTALISTTLAERLAPPAREALRVRAGSRRATLEVLGVIDEQRRTASLHSDDLVLVDIATAQELLEAAGKLSRIELRIDPAQAAAIAERLPPGVVIESIEAHRESLAEMTRAFHTNLTALSMLALIVGVFLIYNSQSFAIVQRRAQFATLRALGLRRRELLALVLGEALCYAAVGAAAGCLLGGVLARGLLQLVARTINDLYFRLSVTEVDLDPASLATGVLLALGGALIAALLPALAAARTEPRLGLNRAALEATALRIVRAAAWSSLAVAAAGTALLAMPSGGLGAGFAGLFLLLVAVALLTPAVLLLVARLLGALCAPARWPAPALAVRSIDASPSRTGTAAAVLTVAVATTVGIAIMVHSFRSSVSAWLDSVLQADYYVSAVSGNHSARPPLSLAVAEALAALPEVTSVTHVLGLDVAGGPGGRTRLNVYRLNEAARSGFQLLEVAMAPQAFWQAFEAGEVVMASEPYARHHGLRAGDTLTLVTPAGEREYRLGAVYRDYGSDRGNVAMSRAAFARHWDDPSVTGIGLYLDGEVDDAALRRRVAQVLPAAGDFDIVANATIKEMSLDVFDQTFAITEVLRVIATIVAMAGTFSALLAIQLERRRELAVLRAIGVGPRQMHGIVIGESALIGLTAGLLAVPAGIMVALCLVEVINERAFGWSMSLDLSAGQLAGAVLMALGAATLAGWYPARRSLRIEPAIAMRIE